MSLEMDLQENPIHFEGNWKGWAFKIETFLGPEMATAPPPPHTNTYTAAAKLLYIKLPMFFIWRLDFDFDVGKSITRAIGRGGPSKWICPHQNHYVLHHINNRYINS
jgi:hypothetical protein